MIYFYTPNETRKKQLITLFNRLSLDNAMLSPSMLGQNVGNIVGINRSSKSGPVPPFIAMPEIILFYRLSDMELDRFLEQYKKDGIEAIPLKAIITPVNINWSLYELIENLRQEQKLIGK